MTPLLIALIVGLVWLLIAFLALAIVAVASSADTARERIAARVGLRPAQAIFPEPRTARMPTLGTASKFEVGSV